MAAAGGANRVTARRHAKVQGLCRLHWLGGGGAERDPWPGGPATSVSVTAGLLEDLVLATAWFVAGAVLAPAEAQNQLEGGVGLLLLAAVSASEAGLAAKRVRQSD